MILWSCLQKGSESPEEPSYFSLTCPVCGPFVSAMSKRSDPTSTLVPGKDKQKEEDLFYMKQIYKSTGIHALVLCFLNSSASLSLWKK